MKIALKKHVVAALIDKKSKQGVSPTWFVNDLLERVLINQSPYVDTEANIHAFLCSFDFFYEYGVGKHKISELYDSFILGPYNECHFLTQSEFIKVIETYVSDKGYTFVLNKPQTSFSLIMEAEPEEKSYEVDKSILFYLDNYIELGVPIMNSEMLEKIIKELDMDISHQLLTFHKQYWADSKGYKIIRGKYNNGRWTKFKKLTFEQQIREDAKIMAPTNKNPEWVQEVEKGDDGERTFD